MIKCLTNLLTLPYRLWMLDSGYYMWCNKCHTIVSGGFGYTEHNVNKFMCSTCAESQSQEMKNRDMLSQAASKDQTKRRVFNG